MFNDGSQGEKRALNEASDAAGKAIDDIGITDLAKLDAGQWQAVIRAACHAYTKCNFLDYIDALVPF